jgi:hypothetical protein
VWLKTSPLRICFPRLYEVCYDKDGSVEKYASMGWQFSCKRMLGPMEMAEWDELQNLLRGVSISSEDDEVP